MPDFDIDFVKIIAMKSLVMCRVSMGMIKWRKSSLLDLCRRVLHCAMWGGFEMPYGQVGPIAKLVPNNS